MRNIFTFFFVLLFALPVSAYTEMRSSSEEERTILDYIKDYVDVPEGALDWQMIGKTKGVEAHSQTEDGYDNQYVQPIFTDELKAYDGQIVMIKGFMFPLDGAEEQKIFLFGPFPMSCPFQYHVGPPLVVEVHAQDNPVTFSYDPVLLKGELELVPDDPEYSTFYRLKNAYQVK